jgi:hypothetical protein
MPPPESVSKWGEEMVVHFEDVSGTQGSKPEGWVYSIRDGDRWDQAVSDAFGIPMQVVDSRRELKGEVDVCFKCKPIFGTDEMTAPVNAPKPRQFKTETSYPVDIKLQFRERMVPMKITSSTRPGSVEFQARIAFGTAVEFIQPRPASWTPGRVYHMKKVNNPRMTPVSGNVTVRMTMRYSSVRVAIPNVIIPRTAAVRDAINAWWTAVETNHIVDPTVLCLQRDPEAFDIQDENGNQVWRGGSGNLPRTIEQNSSRSYARGYHMGWTRRPRTSTQVVICLKSLSGGGSLTSTWKMDRVLQDTRRARRNRITAFH